MGDGKDREAPGNVWMSTDKWPVDHKATPYYMQQDGALAPAPSREKSASLSYDYDPKNPVPTLGGKYDVSDPKRMQIGPLDQRPQADRKDILRFKTAVLEEPVGVTGKIIAELYVSSDCPDTMFTAKLIDIYPDGYEAVIRDSAMLARYSQGLDKPAPLEKGKVYKLRMDMWSTALVFNKGHRIGIYVSSSSDPAYEVHPNTYQPVNSMNDARVAHNTLHLSADHPSSVILPIVPKETYINLGPGRR
jgi:putative CocE/NonD family hydrolase